MHPAPGGDLGPSALSCKGGIDAGQEGATCQRNALPIWLISLVYGKGDQSSKSGASDNKRKKLKDGQRTYTLPMIVDEQGRCILVRMLERNIPENVKS